jgi:hypothetical protein
LPDGEAVDLELQPGDTVLPVRVAVADGDHTLEATLVAGETALDEISRSVRFITIKTVLPAIVVGGVLVLVGLYFLARRLLKGRRPRWPRTWRIRIQRAK